jgi:hypothetical protein
MAEKKSDVKVISLGVSYEGDVPVFHNTKLEITGTISKDKGLKSEISKNVKWICVLDGTKVEDAMPEFGASIRIKMATIRERDDFVAACDALMNGEVRYDEIETWTNVGGKGKLSFLGQALVKAGFSRDEAKAILEDEERRKKAEEWLASLEKPSL